MSAAGATPSTQINRQAETIERYQRVNDGLTKRAEKLQEMYDDSQEYIAKLKRERAELEAQLTPEAKANWIFSNEVQAND